jgi:hypothetical protein
MQSLAMSLSAPRSGRRSSRGARLKRAAACRSRLYYLLSRTRAKSASFKDLCSSRLGCRAFSPMFVISTHLTSMRHLSSHRFIRRCPSLLTSIEQDIVQRRRRRHTLRNATGARSISPSCAFVPTPFCLYIRYRADTLTASRGEGISGSMLQKGAGIGLMLVGGYLISRFRRSRAHRGIWTSASSCATTTTTPSLWPDCRRGPRGRKQLGKFDRPHEKNEPTRC